MAAFLDACRFNPTAGGTTDWTYSSAVNGYQSPAAANVVNGRLYKYRAESADLSQWELGEGAYNTGTGVLARTNVLFNSSGNTSKINFSAAPQVAVVALKEDLLSVEEANSFTANQKARARANLGVLKKNYLINGAMMVSQENGTTAGTASGYVPVDMFQVNVSNAGAVSMAQVVSTTPAGSPNRLRITVTSADASVGASDFIHVFQSLEGRRVADLMPGLSTAKTVTIQFGCKAPAGTYALNVRNGAGRAYVADFVISAGEANTDVVRSVTIALDPGGGAWATDTSASFLVSWVIMCGTTFQTTPNTWTSGTFLGTSSTSNFMGTNSNVFELFDVSLTEGSAAPPFQVPDFENELRLCKRYWEKSYAYSVAVGTAGVIAGCETYFFNAPLTSGSYQLGYKVSFIPKRVAPTITTYSYATGTSGKVADLIAGNDINSTVDAITENAARIYATSSTSVTTVARAYQWVANARI